MSGSLVGGVIGVALSYASNGLFSPFTGWAIGAVAGGLLDPPTTNGGSIDVHPQSSEYGRPIPIIYSVIATGGNVIWAADLVKTSDGGGKGGGSATGPTYAASFAVLICEGAGDKALGRIWAGPDRRLIYDPATLTLESGALRFYDGAETQMPDPLMESALGAGNVPAYRGSCYLVIEGFDVSAHDGNRIPFLTIEVGGKGTGGTTGGPADLGTVWFDYVLDTGTTFIASYHGSYFGLLEHRKADMTLVHNRLVGDSWEPFDILFWDAARSVVVRAHRNLSSATSDSGVYATMNLASGAMVWHTPFTPAAGEELKGGVLSAGRYVFAFAIGGGGTKLYYVDAGAHTLIGTQTVDAGGARVSYLYGADTADAWAWAALDNGTIARMELDGSSGASTGFGAAPAGFSGGSAGAYDPNTATLWTFGIVSSTLYWGQFDQLGGRSSGSTASPFFAVADQPWCFVPGGTNEAWICGEVWLATDQFLEFNSDTGALMGPQTGVYHGTNNLTAAMYDSTRGQVVGYRYGGSYALSTTQEPPSLPYTTGYLGGAEVGGFASLSYQTLAEVVTDLSLRAGLTTGQIDVTQLTDQVDGYIVANQTPVKDAIATLMPAYYFDEVESGGKVKFVKRGGALAVAIPDDDLGAAHSGAEQADMLGTTRGMDDELPGTLSVNYLLAATKYQEATKYSRRLVGYSGSESRLDFPLAFTDQKAQEISAVNLHDAWTSRLAYVTSLPRKYAYLEPTDVVGIQGYTMRVTKMTQTAEGFYKCDAVRDDSTTYMPNVIVTETPPTPSTVATPSLTLLELM